MQESLILKITTKNENITIVSKNKADMSIKNIDLKLVMAHCWWERVPAFQTFLDVLEGIIKQSISEIYDHDYIIIDYDYKANDLLEDASELTIEFNSIKVDDKEVEVIGKFIMLKGVDKRGFLKKISSFRRKIHENVHKKL